LTVRPVFSSSNASISERHVWPIIICVLRNSLDKILTDRGEAIDQPRVLGQQPDRMWHARRDQVYVAWAQARLLITDDDQDVPFGHIGNLLMGVGMGRIGLLLGPS